MNTKRLISLRPLGLIVPTVLLFWLGAVAAVAAPPQIQPSVTFQHTAMFLGQTNTFTVMATGTALSYQWRLNGRDLPGQTNQSCIRANIQPADEGDYSVQVSNADGTVVSEATRLWVVPPSTNLIQANFTNQGGLRLPYFITLPTDYDPVRSYPLVLMFHGAGITGPFDETFFPGFASRWPFTLVFASYHQQATAPVVLVWLSRRAGDDYWTDSYLHLVSGLLAQLTADLNIDTNRVYVGGGSEGVHAAWDMIGLRPGFFAGATVCAGGRGIAPPASIKDVPFWGWHSLQDEYGGAEAMRTLIRYLRLEGDNAIYTEYLRGSHMESIAMGIQTPAIVDWLLAQRRAGPSTAEPLLSISSPTAEPDYASSVTTLDLAGSAQALGQAISRVDWTNTATHGSGVASGTDPWSVTGIPLVLPATNVIIVTATTTSWSAGYGGNTTFSDTLIVGWQWPVISTQPTNQAVRADTTASFIVVASSPQPMTYQWHFNNAPMADATNTTLTLTNVQARHAGTYTVLVSDSSGSVTSAPAMLTVLFAPFIVQQPCNVTVPQGGYVTLSVAVTNTATLPIGYRWRRGSTTVAHAVLSEYVNFLTLTNCQVTTNYEVVVTNLSRLGIRSSNTVVTVLAETDGDGLPDAWEIACGINQATPNHAAADDDGDGVSNLQEYLAGTDPTNALSYLKVESITLAEGGSQVVLSFSAASNTTYTVQYRDAVDTGQWNRLADVVAAPTDRVMKVMDPAVGVGTFHRIYRLATPRVP